MTTGMSVKGEELGEEEGLDDGEVWLCSEPPLLEVAPLLDDTAPPWLEVWALDAADDDAELDDAALPWLDV